jgi:hypothetical protein
MKRAGWGIALAVLALGCAPKTEYDGLSFEPKSAPPLPVSFEPDRIEIPVGIAVKVDVKLHSDGREYDDDDLLTLRADDEDVLEVYGAGSDRAFVFVGLREGDTCLEVRVNRKEQECIEVRVLP